MLWICQTIQFHIELALRNVVKGRFPKASYRVWTNYGQYGIMAKPCMAIFDRSLALRIEQQKQTSYRFADEKYTDMGLNR